MMKAALLLLSVLWFFSCGSTKDHDSLLEKGDIAFSRREYINAINIWKKAHRKKPDDVVIIRKLSDAYVKLGRFDRALRVLTKAFEIVPDDINIGLQMARLNMLTFDYSQAEKLIITL